VLLVWDVSQAREYNCVRRAAKIFPRMGSGEDFANNPASKLRRGRRTRRRTGVDRGVRLRFGRRRRRFFHDGRVALGLFRGWISDGSLLLLTRDKQRGASQNADIFFHMCYLTG
jgi:hypothetical protein